MMILDKPLGCENFYSVCNYITLQSVDKDPTMSHIK